MKKYLQAIYQSFGSPALYTQVIYRWNGAGLLYLLIVSALLSLMICSYTSYKFYSFTQEELPSLAAQIPEVIIVNGEATSKVEQPYIVKDEKQRPLLIVDTNLIDEDKLPDDKGAIFIARKFVLMKQEKDQYKRFNYSEFGNRKIVINKEKITSLFVMLPFLSYVLFPFIMISQWLVLVALTLIAACLSYVVTAYMPEEYNFETRMRMAVIAITPPLIVNKLLTAFSDYHLGFWIILVFWVLHLYLMIIATRYHVKNNPLDAV